MKIVVNYYFLLLFYYLFYCLIVAINSSSHNINRIASNIIIIFHPSQQFVNFIRLIFYKTQLFIF